MFIQRFYDQADYPQGYLISVFGIVIEIFGREFIIH
jgi:hypothetical protein